MRKYIKTAMATFALVATLVTCSRDRGTTPVSGSLRVYVGGIDYFADGPTRSVMFVYERDDSSLGVVDSFVLPQPSESAALDDEGSTIYVCVSDGQAEHSIWAFDLSTKTSPWHYEIDHWVSPPGGLARLRLLDAGEMLLFNRTLISKDGDLIRTFPQAWKPFGGPTQGGNIAMGLQTDSGAILHGYDSNADSLWGGYMPTLLSGQRLNVVYTAELHSDNRKVLAIGVLGALNNAWFVVGDLQTGETLLQQQMALPFGEIEVTPDGRRCFVSDPAQTLFLETSPTLDEYDLDSLRHVSRLIWELGHSEVLIFPGQLRWVDEANLLVTAPLGDFSSASELTLVRPNPLEIDTTFSLPGRTEEFGYFIGGMTAGMHMSQGSKSKTK